MEGKKEAERLERIAARKRSEEEEEREEKEQIQKEQEEQQRRQEADRLRREEEAERLRREKEEEEKGGSLFSNFWRKSKVCGFFPRKEMVDIYANDVVWPDRIETHTAAKKSLPAAASACATPCTRFKARREPNPRRCGGTANVVRLHARLQTSGEGKLARLPLRI